MVQAGETAEPGINAIGFALRPACVQQTTIALAFALSGAPVKSWYLTRPLSAFCAGAMRAGPVDPVLYEVDEAVGVPAQEALEPALIAVNPAIEQVRPQIALACVGLGLAAPSALPPPLHRFNATNELCWR